MRETRVVFCPTLAKLLLEKGFSVVDISLSSDNGVHSFIFEENGDLKNIMSQFMPKR